MAGDGDTGDLLMVVLPYKGKPIAGDSTSTLTSNSALFKGFTPKFMFEISNFKFSVQSLRDDEVEKKAQAAAAAAVGRAAAGGGGPAQPVAGAARTVPMVRTHKTGEAQSCPVQPITFDRPIDSASPVLLSHFVKCTTMYGAVVVKRKPAGGPLAGEPFLRLEFIGVLFTNIQWSNDDPVTENCTFIARAVNVQYKPQLPDGSLGAVCNGFWSRIPNKKEELSF